MGSKLTYLYALRYSLAAMRIWNRNSILWRQFSTPTNIEVKTFEAISSTITPTPTPIICFVESWQRKYNIDILNYFVEAMTASTESRLLLTHFNILFNMCPTDILWSKIN